MFESSMRSSFNLARNRPFRNLGKGTRENAAHSDSLGNSGKSGNPLRFVDKGTACVLVAPRCNL